jgi:hypothetical protein
LLGFAIAQSAALAADNRAFAFGGNQICGAPALATAMALQVMRLDKESADANHSTNCGRSYADVRE